MVVPKRILTSTPKDTYFNPKRYLLQPQKILTSTPKAVYFNFLSSFLLSQTIERNRTFLGSIHSGCRFLTEIIQYLIGMIAGDTEFANYILHRDICLLYTSDAADE